jgi:DNA-binding NtrC family response regulator
MDPKARLILSQYSWPGNIRELRNCIESSIVMCKGKIITVDDLPPYLRISGDKDSIKLNTGLTLAEAERQIISFTLNQQGGNKSKTANILGIGRKTLHRKLQEYKIET